MDWNSLSNTAIIAEIGKRVRDYRIKKRLTQQQLAEQSGISNFTMAKIEKGAPVSIGMLIPVLRELRLLNNLEMLLPEIGISPVEILKRNSKTPKRIRQAKKTK
jgi:transcriptional regulator with XRE-family HTH domain